ncbi:hypothetical protein AB8W27_15080 [Cronobacter turicensis]|uniref:Uncharacterized protein n=1 Tax=Cronobacter turicensis (strain DSM 18703 / CCUG 55852 / LMG 23827 / z3032) TaxID=693216 RepID=C9XY14_CROTZ|nr:hypothetical protein [Cronobacter turicensis]MDI6470656.1 hypothetical protein [Cronobacter turicensis]CBA28898.1 unknown protein [Cronobacter turicensis z3032]
MSTISNERLEKLSEYDCADRYEVMSMATELLALRKERERAEPVCLEAMPFTWEELKGMHGADFATGYVRGWERKCASLEMKGPLYTAPPVPDERYQQLSELYHAQEKRLFKLAQRIKGPTFDKYAHSPSQAIDVLEAAVFGETDEDGHAAMLQSGNDEIGSWSNHKNTPTDKPKSELSQMAEKLVRDTTALAVTLSAENDTTPQQFESLAFKSVVPEGWKLVPIVLTKEMRGKIHPFAEALCHGCGREVVADCEYNVTASWNDMLAVAPEPCK